LVVNNEKVDNIKSCDIRVRCDEAISATIELYPKDIIFDDIDIYINLGSKTYRVIEASIEVNKELID